MSTADEKLPKILELHKDDLEDTNFDMRVAGTTFVENHEEILGLLKSVPQEKLNLVFSREPENEYDSNAVRVSIKVEGFEKSRFVGYIPKTHSEMVSYVLSHRDEYRLLVTRPVLCGGVEGKENVGIFFNMKIERRVTN